MTRCPHGDPTCPCQDGDSCHYERSGGTAAWPCPTMPAGHRFRPHCHVEGCDWKGELPDCGLLRIAPETTLDKALAIGCGATRLEANRPLYYKETT